MRVGKRAKGGKEDVVVVRRTAVWLLLPSLGFQAARRAASTALGGKEHVRDDDRKPEGAGSSQKQKTRDGEGRQGSTERQAGGRRRLRDLDVHFFSRLQSGTEALARAIDLLGGPPGFVGGLLSSCEIREVQKVRVEGER